MISASEISLKQNHALIANLPKLGVKPNHSKSPIYLMKGDPTEFGLKHCRMAEDGYQILKEEIHKQDTHSYSMSTGSIDARQALANKFNHGKNISPEDVIVTQGVNQGLYYIFHSVCEEGTNILVPELGYPFYDQIAPAYGVEIRKYKLKPNSNWEIDLEDLNSLLDKNTKILFIINPSNPCGSVFSRQHVLELIKWAEQNCVLIVADEVYYGLSFGDFTSFGELANDGPIICLSGMEKIFYVPGWQISWMIFYDKNNYIKAIKEAVGNMCQLMLHPNTFLMSALPKILNQLGVDYVLKSVKTLKDNHDFLVGELNRIQGIQAIPAQGTFYLSLLFDLEVLDFKDDVDFVTKALEEENFQAFPLSCMGNKNYNGIRLLTCVDRPILEDMVLRLKSFCTRHMQ